MMLRGICILSLFIGCALAGDRASGRLKKRKLLLEAFLRDIRRISMLIKYTVQPLPVICDRLSDSELFVFWQQFKEQIRLGSSSEIAWNHAMQTSYDALSSLMLLKQEERSVMADFSKELGRTDTEAQLNNINMCLQLLEEIQISVQQEYQKKGRLFRSMGVLVGIAVTILVI